MLLKLAIAFTVIKTYFISLIEVCRYKTKLKETIINPLIVDIDNI
jgi:hypothetical protein